TGCYSWRRRRLVETVADSMKIGRVRCYIDPQAGGGGRPLSLGPPMTIPTQPGAATLCVLLADDSPVARLAIARRLRAEGFRVLEGASGGEALASAAMGTPVGCALLDLDLGDADGSEVAARLRSTRADLPIAFFSD